MTNGGVILIIDDDIDYSCLLQVALMEAPVDNPIQVINDGGAAIDHLKTLDGWIKLHQTRLALVLLDLRMPRLGGLEVLRWMRGESHLAAVPVVVCTGVETGAEPAEALALGATGLFPKPFSYCDLLTGVRHLRDRYLGFPGLSQAA